MSGKGKKVKHPKEESETGGSGSTTALTPGQWAFKWVFIPIFTFFAVAGVTAITVFFVLQGGATMGVSAAVVDLIAGVSGIMMFIAYAASWGRALFEMAGIMTPNPTVEEDPKKKIPHGVKKAIKAKASQYTLPSLFISFVAAIFIAMGAYLGWVVFAAAFGLPMLVFQIMGAISGVGMGAVLGYFLHGLQIENYEDHMVNQYRKHHHLDDESKKMPRGQRLSVQVMGIFIAVMASVGFGVFKAFPINDFFASLGLATGELLFDLTVVGTIIIIISSAFTTSWRLWNVFKAWSNGETRDSGSKYPPPATLVGKFFGYLTLICASALNAAGPAISIFIFITATTPIPPVAIFLWSMAAIFFVARWIDFHFTNGEYTLNSFKRLEEWLGFGKASSVKGWSAEQTHAKRLAPEQQIEMATLHDEQSKQSTHLNRRHLYVDTTNTEATRDAALTAMTHRPVDHVTVAP